jgi:flagellar FliL protein
MMDDTPTAETTSPPEGNASATTPETAPKKLNKLVIIAGIVGVLALTLAVLFFTGTLQKLFHHKEESSIEKVQKPTQILYFDLPEIIVNLNSVGRKISFLKLSLSIEVNEEAQMKRLEQIKPRILDQFQVYLRQLKIEDLRGSAGLQQLREELMMRLNATMSPLTANDILFKEMLVQ